eukprot:5300026-Pleurochrysis_carterae.AAC.1
MEGAVRSMRGPVCSLVCALARRALCGVGILAAGGERPLEVKLVEPEVGGVLVAGEDGQRL